MDAYNLWIAEFSAHAPARLLGLGQVALRSIDQGVEELRTIKRLGLRGAMLPGRPAIAATDAAGRSSPSANRACEAFLPCSVSSPPAVVTPPAQRRRNFLRAATP